MFLTEGKYISGKSMTHAVQPSLLWQRTCWCVAHEWQSNRWIRIICSTLFPQRCLEMIRPPHESHVSRKYPRCLTSPGYFPTTATREKNINNLSDPRRLVQLIVLWVRTKQKKNHIKTYQHIMCFWVFQHLIDSVVTAAREGKMGGASSCSMPGVCQIQYTGDKIGI